MLLRRLADQLMSAAAVEVKIAAGHELKHKAAMSKVGDE